jgi:hypothetical protein
MNEDGRDDRTEKDLEAIPRVSFWSAMPKRSVSRIIMMILALAGILYLREKTGAVAGCMGDAFNAPYHPASPATIRGTVAIPGKDASSP